MGKLRRAIASFSIVAILSSFVLTTSVSAQVHTFNDVPAWATVYVDALIPSGAITNKSGTFRPADNVVRAEAFKMVDLAIGFERGALGSWPDVKEADWYYGHIQDLFGAGVVKGAADGMMYPGNAINRAEAAKLVVEASGVTCADSETTNKFSDVAAGQWYTKYVACGVREGWFNGYADGTFRPANFINRAEFAKLAAVSADLAEPTEETPVTPVAGDVTVKRSAKTPETVPVPASASSVEFAAFDFTAGGEDAEINEVVVTRKGVINDNAFAGVYLYHEDGTRLTTKKSINSDDHTVTFSALEVEVPAGETVTLSVRADIAANPTQGEGYFQLESADMVGLAGDGTVGGSFPVSGNPMNILEIDAGSVTVTKSGTVNNPSLGQFAKIGEFRLEVEGEDAEVMELAVTVKGSANTQAFQKLELQDQNGEVVATAPGVAGSEDLAVFSFEEPYMIEEGASRVFRVYAQVLGSDSDDDVQVFFDQDTDILAIGGDYGAGLAVDRGNEAGDAGTYGGDSCDGNNGVADECSYSTIEGGDVTIAFNGPVARDVSLDGKDVHLLEFSMTAANDVSVEGMDFIVYADDDDDSDPFDGVPAGDDDADGLLVADESEANLTDIKLIDLDSTRTVLSSEELDLAGNDASQTLNYTDSFTIEAGETRNFALTVDITDADGMDGEKIGAALDISGLEIEDVNGDELASTEIVPSTDVVGKAMTVIDAELFTTLSGTPTSDTYVKGSKMVPLVGMNFRASDAEAVTVTQLTLTCNVDKDNDNAFDDAAEDDAAQNYLSSVYLVVDGEQIAGPEGVESDGTVLFENLDWEIPASKTHKVVVKADLASPSAVTNDEIGCGIEAVADVVAQDTEGDDVAASAAVNTEAVIEAGNGVILTVSDSGSLTFSVEESPTEESLLVAGSEDVLVTKYRFNAVDEEFVVNDLDVVMVTNASANADSAVNTYQRAYTGVSLKYTNSEGEVVTEDGNFASGEAKFTGLDMLVPKDGQAYLEVYVDLNTIQSGALSGDDVRVAIQTDNDNTTNDFEAIGAGSGQTLNAASGGLTMPTDLARVEQNVLRETVPTVALSGSSGELFVSGGGKTLYKFSVAADAAETVSMKAVKLRATLSVDADTTLGLFKLFRGNTNITDDVTITASGDLTSDEVDGTNLESAGAMVDDFDGYFVITWEDEEDVSAGETQTYELEATAAGVDDAEDSLTVYIEDDSEEVENFASWYALFDIDRIKIGTDNGSADYVFYDVFDDTAANNGAACSNTSDDVVLGGTAPADCDAVASVTPARIKTAIDNGTEDYLFYDVSNDTAANNGAACNNIVDDVALAGTSPADCDAGGVTAVDLHDLAYVYDSTNSDVEGIFYDISSDRAAVDGAACTGVANDLLASPDAIADCTYLTADGGSVFNLVWSDNSSSSHSTTTEDWTNGYLVDDLDTDARTLTYNS